MTGASGFIGSALVSALAARGHRPVRITRATRREADVIHWDPASGVLDSASLTGIDVVVHLAGARVDERWTAAHKREIRESRVQSTALLARTLASLPRPPAALVSASAIGIYGSRGDDVLDESSTTGSGFLAAVGREWEAAAAPASDAGIRTVHARFGIVLARDGGALARLLPPFELGAGGKIASGTQWMSWVARDDLVRAVLFVMEADAVRGAVNVTAPHPVTNAEFAKTLGRVLRRPTVATIPAFALRLVYGELADAALLASQRVLPQALTAAGFKFQFPTLEAALRHELANSQ